MINTEKATFYKLSDGTPLVNVETNTDYILTLTTPIEFRNVISTNVLLFNTIDAELYTYIYTINIDMEGNISISRPMGTSKDIDIATDYKDSISSYVHIIKEIYRHKINAPYFSLPSFAKVINDKIIKILETPIQFHDKFIKCNYNCTSEYASELISRLVVKYCKENKNDESHNENI